MSPSMAACIGLIEVASIAVARIYHVAFVVCDGSRVLGCDVVQYLCQLCHGGFRGFGCLNPSVLRAVRMVLMSEVASPGKQVGCIAFIDGGTRYRSPLDDTCSDAVIEQ